MKLGYRLIRTILVVAIVLVAVVPAALYVALSLSGVQRSIADRAEVELSKQLNAKVTIGSLGIVPFNRVILRDVTVETEPGDTALTVHRLGAGVSIFDALLRDRWRVDYLEVIGADARLRRDSINAPLNIQPIIEALKPKDKNKPPTIFDLKISSVIIRSCAVRYDVENQPHKEVFDPHHIAISNLRADVNLPRIANDDFTVNLRRFAFDEASGLVVENLTGDFHIAANELTAKNFAIKLPSSAFEFNDISLQLDGLNSIKEKLAEGEHTLKLRDGGHVWLPDLQFLDKRLGNVKLMTTIPKFELKGNLSTVSAAICLKLEELATLDLNVDGYNLQEENRIFKVGKLDFFSSGEKLNSQLAESGLLDSQLFSKLNALGRTNLSLKGIGSMKEADAEFNLVCALGNIAGDVEGTYADNRHFSVDGRLESQGYFDLSPFFPEYGPLGFDGTVEGSYFQEGDGRSGNGQLDMNQITLGGHTVSELQIAGVLEGDYAEFDIDVNDPSLMLALSGDIAFGKKDKALKLNLDLPRMMPDRFDLWDKYPGGTISANLTVDLVGEEWLQPQGEIQLTDLTLKPVDSKGITLKNLKINAQGIGADSRITLASDYIEGEIDGQIDFQSIGHSVLDILAVPFPSLLPGHANHFIADNNNATVSTSKEHNHKNINDFVYRFEIKETGPISDFFNLPVTLVYPAKLSGGMSDENHDFELNLDAPYIRQGKKLIENSSLSAYVDGDEERARLDFTTSAPTKEGMMKIDLTASGHEDILRTNLNWKIDRARMYEGLIKTATTFSRPDNQLEAGIDIRKSFLTFNDSTWTIDPATITIRGRNIEVNGINAYHSNQFVKINGNVSPDPAAMLTLDLRHFSLDYLFESLGIDAAMLGGDASGTFYASDLYSGHPALVTPGLNVKNISYNHTVLGDAIVRSRFNPETMAAELSADIDNDGRRSTIDGAIFATRDSLDLTFRVDREPVGFLQPYMAAFASDIKGYASGWARVYGNFKYIDLEGDVYADSVEMRVNFTNTTYWASDSVHIRPGYIDLNGITVHDFQGHSAKLNGWVKHKFFKEPRFEFAITGARELLCYNETPKENPRWYGKIYGNGSAFVKGVPGVVDIAVDMTTAPNSTFTFVLSDQVEAEQYSFLTFRDKNKLAAEIADTLELRDTSMDKVNELRAQAAHHDETPPSVYNISIQMGITPDAQINLVMDPIGGDRIRSFGSGHLRMDYGSANNELKMFGNYTLDRGDYNFTLQDIIIKDFTIKPGSEISFRGDPYAAQLDIQAAYSLNANLSDLDESFLNDSELQRTNVPVNAIMKVSGDIRQPELAFDLEFPTLTSDVYRKVRSIISTDDMMNRQILYLLALNRFYTPDYMAGATRGNELVSVASSTISSQLSSILGQISDNWNIAPQFRSSRGDFSDVEVDVALSSRLLNNRLLFNGNLGYRDKSLNTNQFVGDFDLEYLLNRSGNIRLKAYNRYNDQNYYLRSALTTQGVGIVLRKDFDSLTSFLRPLLAPFRRKQQITIPLAPVAVPSDTIPSDTIPSAIPPAPQQIR